MPGGQSLFYNSGVLNDRHQDANTSKQQARYLETLGLILIAVIIFLITLARYAGHISWSWR
jgi:hypothetical protein